MATESARTPAPWGATIEEALGGGRALPIGQYRVDLTSDTWWWSDELYAMHGLAPGSVEPTSAVLAAAKHQDDRGTLAREISRSRRTGKPFSCLHRIVDAHGRTRTVTVTGQGRRDAKGVVVELVGYVVDQTSAQRDLVDRDVERAVAALAEERVTIERAKGVLMAVYGIDEEAAADKLVLQSSRAGLRVHDVAARLVEALDAGPGLGDAASDVVDGVLTGLSATDRRRPRNAQLVRRFD
ncbi:PAS domain-containing protein [Sediminihabitans luteus]|uniref:PAS domain-containing protein n=1 Tax=Sediminihabitans luteus TaxID=1138585 RepID=A0A2M9CD20_9CELL|nr:PAS and ANTAR domain-containing protein [Sediminihabitans luteus]PJJ69226.1 PAS domain-containing protein [Sediminihabitans luteus]GII98902.1 transcription antitermination regulator [Sediminihabitans luteus]